MKEKCNEEKEKEKGIFDDDDDELKLSELIEITPSK